MCIKFIVSHSNHFFGSHYLMLRLLQHVCDMYFLKGCPFPAIVCRTCERNILDCKGYTFKIVFFLIIKRSKCKILTYFRVKTTVTIGFLCLLHFLARSMIYDLIPWTVAYYLSIIIRITIAFCLIRFCITRLWREQEGACCIHACVFAARAHRLPSLYLGYHVHGLQSGRAICLDAVYTDS